MKKLKIFMLSLLVLVLGACGGEKPVETPPVEDAVQEVEMVVEEVMVKEPEEVEVIDGEAIAEEEEEEATVPMEPVEMVEEGMDQVEIDMAADAADAERDN